MNIKRVPIDSVDLWADNPWNIKTDDYRRLKAQIEELGVYKPLICFAEGERWTCIGGNKRLMALKGLGHTEVDISVVEPKTEAEKLKYAYSDNDHMGTPDKQKIAELTFPHIEEINLETYKISIDEPVSLKSVLKGFGSVGDDEQDPPEESYYTCDNCGYKIPMVDIKGKGRK